MGKKILAVDNHPVILKFLSVFLAKRGHTVLTAEDSLSALEMLDDFTPDVILIDLVMPNINGKKLCRMVRGMERLRNAYIVILSAIAAEEDVDFVACGADAYIAKSSFDTMGEYLLRAIEQSDLKAQGETKVLRLGCEEASERQIAKELLSIERHFEAVLESMAEGIIELSPDWRVVYANRSALSLFGIPEEKLLGLHFNSLFGEEDSVRLDEIRRTCLTEPQHISDESPLVIEGRQITLQIVTHTTDNFSIVILNDVTEKKRFEARIRQAQKMDAIATLTGGIAHDFNNLLAAILGNISLAKLDLKAQERAHKRLEEGEKATLAARDLTHQLLTFSKAGVPVMQVLCLEPLLRNAVSRTFNSPKVRCDLSVVADLMTVCADDDQMYQVIGNLLTNADDAMPGGGTILIKAENAVVNNYNSLSLKPGTYVRISVSDQGSGIPPERLPHIFDPYFTTKDTWSKKGLGLGLAVCHSIIVRHGGTITVESGNGRGTTFSVYLPAESQTKQNRGPAELRALEKTKKILLMDDERAVRDIGGEILKHLGYEVEFAQDGDEALRVFGQARERGHRFDGVILDLIVTGTTVGDKVMKALREMDPTVKGIVSSGYSNDPIMTRYEDYGFSGVVAKPYRIHELEEVLQAVIG